MNDIESYRDIKLLCGAIAEFDDGSGCSFRCTRCFTTVGSVSMPRACKELYDMQDVVDKLTGKKRYD